MKGFLPDTNADGLPVVPMTDEQRYFFDLKGWLLLPSLLTEEQLGPNPGAPDAVPEGP